MARISDEELERLKREVSVERLVEARGVELKRHGANLLGRCPFHEDRTPSLVVTPERNLWHCMGVCQTGGSVVDWVMKAEGVSFRHAVELLRADAPLTSGPGPKKATVPKLPAPVELEADDRQVLRQVVDYYHATLKESPEALAYLGKRGLESAEAIAHFKLGFANRTLGLRLPQKNRDAGEAIRARLQKLGVLRESGHEHFNGSLVVPILDGEGEVLGMYGRKVTPGLRPGTPLHLYLPGPHRGVWNAPALQGQKTVVLCEALLDALTFWAAGFRNVTAAYGVEGFTAEHLAVLKACGAERVLIAYDRDDAGERAAEELANRLAGEGLSSFRVQFPKGMDANDYALKVQPAAKALEVALRQAVFMAKGKGAVAPVPAEVVAALENKAERPPSLAAVGRAEPLSSPAALVAPPTMTAASSHPPAPAAAVLELPVPAAMEVPTEVKGEEVHVVLGERQYRVRGLAKNLSHESLKVNVLAAGGDRFHVDTLEMYSARQRAAYVKEAAGELQVPEDVVKRDLGLVLRKLEELQEANIRKALEPKTKAVAVSDEEREAALELLRAPDLLERILNDFERCGVVGEETNKLVGYLAAVSRKLEEPLAVVIQSSSAAGKTSLMDAVLAFVPPEDRVQYSAMTGQALFYMGDADLKHKVLAIAEEEGAARASYALKLLQSDGQLTIASTGKDPASGRLVTHEYRVEGPAQLFMTTTAIEVDEELLNRSLVLSVDEDREQTRAIHRLQRERQTLEGLLAKREREAVLALHRNAQRLLRPLLVANPYAPSLTFLDDRTRARRDFMKYLTLIRTVALLHQYQRPVKTARDGKGQEVQYIEVTKADIAVANRLAHQALGRSLDELPPQTRRLLLELDKLVGQACQVRKVDRKDYRFTRREVREATGWGNTQLKLHLHRLEEHEYLVAHRAGRGQGFAYELVYEGQGKDGRPFLSGLLEAEHLGREYDTDRSGAEGPKSASGRPEVGPESGVGRGVIPDENRSSGDVLRLAELERPQNSLLGSGAKSSSYAQREALAVAAAGQRA